MNKIKKLTLILLLTVALIITQTACDSKNSDDQAQPVSKSGYYLNTTCEISIYNMDEDEANSKLDEAFAIIEDKENLLSKTVKDSDVYNINHADGQWVEVSDDTLQVLELALEMAELTDGKFDITIGAISEMWNFTGDDPNVPQEQELEEALTGVDYGFVEIDGNKVRLTNDNTQIDLGGIAKGYIADQVTAALEEDGVSSAIVNLGGNVVTIGEKQEDTPFVIGVERPYSDRTEIIGSVEASDMTLVTSGIYERNFEEDGVLYHHVLDPATGYPAETDLEAVTITADTGNSALCDGLSTSCLIMGEEDAKAFIAKVQEKYPDKNIEASFINDEDETTWTDGMNLTLRED